MLYKNRAFRTQVFTAFALVSLALIVCLSPHAYARGARRTDSPGDSGNRSDYRQSRQDNSPSTGQQDQRSNSDQGQRTRTREEPRFDPKPEPRSDPPPDPKPEPAPQPRSDYRSNQPASPTPPATRSNEETRDVPAPQRYRGHQDSPPPPNSSGQQDTRSYHPDNSVVQHSDSGQQSGYDAQQSRSGQTQGQVTRSGDRQGSSAQDQQRGSTDRQGQQGNVIQSHTRPDVRSSDIHADSSGISRGSSSTARIPNLTGVYRKEYADLGQIWKDRSERRSSHSDSRNNGYDRQSGHSNTNVFVNVFPHASYRYYSYNYDPWSCYPSVYCYYSGLFPPFITDYRVVYRHHDIITYHYVEIPIRVVYRDYSVYSSDDDYYLSSYRYRNLSSTLRDIEHAWTSGDATTLLKHVRPESKIDVFLKNEYAYTIESPDYSEMTEDAMSHIRTVSFEIYKVRQRDYNTVEAYGKHTYYDDDVTTLDSDVDLPYANASSKRNTVYVRYTLEKQDGKWYILETGTSPNSAD